VLQQPLIPRMLLFDRNKAADTVSPNLVTSSIVIPFETRAANHSALTLKTMASTEPLQAIAGSCNDLSRAELTSGAKAALPAGSPHGPCTQKLDQQDTNPLTRFGVASGIF
jgi:hypothetical protein